MQLSDLRTEVYAKGFDSGLFPASRVNRFLNEGYLKICRRVEYFTDESTQDFSTVNGTTNYAFPANLARVRDLRNTALNTRLLPVTIRSVDNSGLPGSGPPQYYALDGKNVHLWPTPDGVYPLELRYWLLPAFLVNDTDVPTLPEDYHNLLWMYATAECYDSEDDANTSQYWRQRFQAALSDFAADVKFPDSETPSTAADMWDTDRGLPTQTGWSVFGQWW